MAKNNQNKPSLIVPSTPGEGGTAVAPPQPGPPDDFSKFALPDDGVPTQMVGQMQSRQAYEEQREATHSEMSKLVEAKRLSDIEFAKNNPMVPTMEHVMPEPGDRLSGVVNFHTGQELPKIKVKEGATPLLVEAWYMLRRLVSGGLISPYSLWITDDIDVLASKMRKEIEDVSTGEGAQA